MEQKSSPYLKQILVLNSVHTSLVFFFNVRINLAHERLMLA